MSTKHCLAALHYMLRSLGGTQFDLSSHRCYTLNVVKILPIRPRWMKTQKSIFRCPLDTVQDSSIGDLITHSLSNTPFVLVSSDYNDYNNYDSYDNYDDYDEYNDNRLQ